MLLVNFLNLLYFLLDLIIVLNNNLLKHIFLSIKLLDALINPSRLSSGGCQQLLFQVLNLFIDLFIID
jgi:hypothetical protein